MNTSMDPNATHVWKYRARLARLERIKVRRNQNATARRLGFKNYQSWQGED